MLRIERCTAPFPFDQVIVDRDNNSLPGENAEDETLIPAWAKEERNGQPVEKQSPDEFRSDEEPRRSFDPLRIDLVEDRFEGLRDKKLVKEEKTVQRSQHSPLKVRANQMLTGLGTRSSIGLPSNSRVFGERWSPFMSVHSGSTMPSKASTRSA
jgi:hypothetical protein